MTCPWYAAAAALTDTESAALRGQKEKTMTWANHTVCRAADGRPIFTREAPTLAAACEAHVREGDSLSGADLRGADLTGARLAGTMREEQAC